MQVMSKSEVQEFFKDVSSDKDSLGLITVDRMAMTCGFENLYTFLHLTFQEYLAAYHIKEEKQKGLGVLQYSSNKEHMQVVWKFYCGLVNFNVDGEFASLMDSTRLRKDDDLFCVQCAFESQQSIACDYVVKSGALSFRNHFLTPSDFSAIGYAIYRGSHPVTKLTFNKCNLSTEGITAFLEEVKERIVLSSITTICFHHKACVTEQLVTLKLLLKETVSLELLDISNTNLGPKKIKQFTDDLTLANLTTVIMTPFEKLDKASLKRLTFGSSLQQFVFRGGNISLSLLENALSDNEPLFYRTLSTLPEVSPQLKLPAKGDYCVSKDLKQLSCCTSLDLTELHIGDSGCQHLADSVVHWTKLQTLVLYNNGIGDSGAEHLARFFSACVNISKLDLRLNRIGDAGAIAIAKTIQSCTKLHTFRFGYNLISDAGASALAENISCLTDLGLLQLSYNRIGDEGAIAITKAVSSSCKLEIWNHRISKIGADKIVALKHDVDENFQSFTIVNDTYSKMYDIRFKHIWSSILGDTEKLNNIEVLNFNKDARFVFNQLPAFLKKCCHLRIMNFEEQQYFPPEDVAVTMNSIMNCYNLQELNLSNNNMGMTPMCFTHLANGLKQPKAYNLLTLNLGENYVSVDHMVALADGLKHCSSLQHLLLEHNGIDQKCACVLSECFSHLPNLQSLNLYNNNISTGAPVLIDALKHCKNLTTLNLGRNDIGHHNELDVVWEIDLNCATSLATFFTSANCLQCFNFEANRLGPEGMEIVIDGLKTCDNLQSLNLGGTDMDSHCACVFFDSLKCWSNLRTLALNDCDISSKEIEVLANNLALGHCSCLETLTLDYNCMYSSQWIAILTSGLKHCTNLQVLSLVRNYVGDDGAMALADVLKDCKHLHTLNLNDCEVYDVGRQALTSSLKKCKNIKCSKLI